jgi:SAM-dependent methyltransferase
MRLEAQAKGGYYPTPAAVVERVARLIRVTERSTDSVVKLLDPCCGTGAALAQIAKLLEAQQGAGPSRETYGIELHRDRYEEARQHLNHALCSDAFQTSVANGAFQLLWLNPPYDYDDEKLRQEHKFLLHCTRYITPGGILTFLVPQARLAVSARYLASHYHRLTCYRFPDPEFASFRQVVLLGVRKPESSADLAAEEQIKTWSQGELLPLPPDTDPMYTIPTARSGQVLFSTRALDPEVAVAEARRSGLWASATIQDRLWPVEATTARPLMPLRKGHLAMLIAAGFLNNLCLEAGGQRVLVKGRAYKEFILAESTEESETHREVLRTSVVALNLDSGEFEDIQA